MSRRSATSLTRAFKQPLRSVNAGKLQLLTAAQQRMAREAELISHYVERRVMSTGALPAFTGDLKFANIPAIGWASPLYAYVAAQWKSWIANRHREFARLVFRLAHDKKIPESLRHELMLTSKCMLWHVPLSRGIAQLSGVTFTPEGRSWARTIFKAVCRAHRKPSFRNVPVYLDDRMAQLEPAQKSRFYHFTHWLRIDAPTQWPDTPIRNLDAAVYAERVGYAKKKKVEGEVLSVPASGKKRKSPAKLSTAYLPLKLSEHFLRAPGKANQTIAILPPRLDKGRASWELALTRTGEVQDWAPEPVAWQTERLAIDLGLATFIATNQGDLIEQGWMGRIEALDREIVALARGRQQRGLRVRCARYDELVTKLRNWLKSRIGQALCELVRSRRPKIVVVEALDFRAPGLSRRVNRLLANFGQGTIGRWLNDNKRIYGFELEEVNPAFSSVQCSACGYIDSRNRKSQAEFRCVGCGHSAHADTHAAVNLAGRSCLGRKGSKEGGLPVWASPRVAYQWLWRSFIDRKTSPFAKQGWIWAADSGAFSAQFLELVKDNPSFRKYGNASWLTSPNVA